MKKKLLTLGLFKRTFDNLKVIRLLWRDFRKGKYKTVPLKAMTAIVLLFAYIINPFDLLSDFIPLWGQLDDAGVLMICLYLLDKETTQYQLWRKNNPQDQF